jgi:glycosyltransferase involved in cell wall biosynthesis
MKISVWHNLPFCGGFRQVYYHVRGLAARGHFIHAWRPDTPSCAGLSDLVSETIIPYTISAKAWPKGKFRQSLWLLQNTRMQIEALQRHCQQVALDAERAGLDVAFVNSSIPDRMSPLAQYFPFPSAVYLGEPRRELYEAQYGAHWLAIPPPKRPLGSPAYWKWWLEDHIELYARRLKAKEEYDNAKAYDAILVNSLYSRECVLRAYGLESKVCYLGIDTDLFRPLPVTRENFVVGLGSISRKKGIDRALKALATIQTDKRPALVWIGNAMEPAYLAELQRLAESLNVVFDHKIMVPEQELVESLNRAALMLYTSRLEPFGLAPLEANACETPVVAIAEGGVRESIQHGVNGLLVPEDNPEMLGAAVMELIDDPQKAREMGRRAREHVKAHWNWESAIDRIEQHLARLAGKLSMQ